MHRESYREQRDSYRGSDIWMGHHEIVQTSLECQASYSVDLREDYRVFTWFSHLDAMYSKSFLDLIKITITKRLLDLNCWQQMELKEITIKVYAFATCFVFLSMCVMYYIVGFAIRCIFSFFGWVRRECLRCVYPQTPAHSQTMDQPLPPYIDELRKQLQDLSQSVQELRMQVSQLDQKSDAKQTRSPGQHERSTP